MLMTCGDVVAAYRHIMVHSDGQQAAQGSNISFLSKLTIHAGIVLIINLNASIAQAPVATL